MKRFGFIGSMLATAVAGLIPAPLKAAALPVAPVAVSFREALGEKRWLEIGGPTINPNFRWPKQGYELDGGSRPQIILQSMTAGAAAKLGIEVGWLD